MEESDWIEDFGLQCFVSFFFFFFFVSRFAVRLAVGNLASMYLRIGTPFLFFFFFFLVLNAAE